MSSAISQYVVPGLEAAGGAVSEFFAPGNPIGTSLLGSGVGQLAGGAAGGSQGQSLGGSLGSLAGGLGSSLYSGSTNGLGIGGNSGLGGFSDPLGGLLGGGGGGGGSQGQQFASPFKSMQPAGSLAGLPFYSADQYANYGPNAPGLTGPGFTNSASFAPPVPPPPANLSPLGTGGGSPISAYLSAGGGGPTTTPIDPNALSGALNAPTAGSIGNALAADNASTGGGDPSTQWYSQLSNPAYWQGAGTVGAAYLKYLEGTKQELAHPFQSAVLAPTYNPLAGVKSSPITPPQLTV